MSCSGPTPGKVKRIMRRLAFALKACLQPAELYPLRQFPALDMNDCVRRFFRNVQTAQFYADLSGARYLLFLQPYARKGRPSISKFEIAADIHKNKVLDSNNRSVPELIDDFYSRVIQENPRLPIEDLRDIFRNYQGEIYFDNVHLSDIGQDLIAQKITERIVQEELA